MPDPNNKNGTLPPWQKYLSKYDVDGDGITSGEEMGFALKSGFQELISRGKNVISSMADGSMQSSGGGQADGTTTPAEYAMLAASFIGPGGFAKSGVRGLLSKGKNIMQKGFGAKNNSQIIPKITGDVKEIANANLRKGLNPTSNPKNIMQKGFGAKNNSQEVPKITGELKEIANAKFKKYFNQTSKPVDYKGASPMYDNYGFPSR